MNHVPYEWVEVPADIRKMIEANDSQTFDDVSTNNYSIFVYNFFLVQMWVKILVNHHPIQFTKKSAFAIWKIADQHKWHLDDNPVMSAQKVIQHAMEEKVASGLPQVSIIPIRGQDNYEALAFSVPHILQKWHSCIRKVLTDSSCMYII